MSTTTPRLAWGHLLDRESRARVEAELAQPKPRPLPWIVRVQRWYTYGPRSGAIIARAVVPRLRPSPALLSVVACLAPVVACWMLHPVAGLFALAPAALLLEVRLSPDSAQVVATLAQLAAARRRVPVSRE